MTEFDALFQLQNGDVEEFFDKLSLLKEMKSRFADMADAYEQMSSNAESRVLDNMTTVLNKHFNVPNKGKSVVMQLQRNREDGICVSLK